MPGGGGRRSVNATFAVSAMDSQSVATSFKNNGSTLSLRSTKRCATARCCGRRADDSQLMLGFSVIAGSSWSACTKSPVAQTAFSAPCRAASYGHWTTPIRLPVRSCLQRSARDAGLQRVEHAPRFVEARLRRLWHVSVRTTLPTIAGNWSGIGTGDSSTTNSSWQYAQGRGRCLCAVHRSRRTPERRCYFDGITQSPSPL